MDSKISIVSPDSSDEVGIGTRADTIDQDDGEDELL